MKPKDLLEHLEKGDRTMHHLTRKPEAQMFSGVTLGTLSSTALNQFANQVLTTSQYSMWQGNQQADNTTTGGIVRW